MQRLYSRALKKALRYYAMLRNFAKAACKRSSPVARPPISQAARPPASSKVDPTNATICRSLAIHDTICRRCKINIPPPELSYSTEQSSKNVEPRDRRRCRWTTDIGRTRDTQKVPCRGKMQGIQHLALKQLITHIPGF